MTYLFLPRIQVQAANALATAWIINATPLFAINMFGHNLGRKIGAIPAGVAVIHHDAQLLGEREGKGFYGRMHPQQRRGASFIDRADYSSKNQHVLSLQPTASCHLLLSLMFAFETSIDLEAVNTFLLSARIAGGQIIDYGKPEVLGDEAALRGRLRTGFWVIERDDLMQAESDPLAAVVKAIGEKAVPANEGDLPNSWIVPTVLGYAALTPFEARAGARGGYLHAYGESLVGLVQYVSVRDYGDRPLPLWHYQWIGEDVFVIKQKKGAER
ncbi:MAG: type I-F CRISPR-associated protein Csy2 [Nitrospirae bacterium]|nr:MAG: type I-F CRISPR-associated protein Csy2 [Nitrospirota bacterium]